LEESVLSEEKKLTVRGPSPDGPPACLPARVREIVTKNLSESGAGAMSSVMSLQEENRVLQGELARLEDLLAHSRADRDELAIKYGAISERLEQALRFDTADGDCDAAEPRSLAQQTLDLRRRLEEEQAAYKRKLTAYQEGQQRQAQLVQKLQAKVRLFYSPLYPRQRLTLSSLVGTAGASVQEAVWGFRADPAGEDLRVGQTPAEYEQSSNLEDALIRLEEEQQRSAERPGVNIRLLLPRGGFYICPCVFQEQQFVGGQRHAEGAARTGRRGQRGSEPGHPQAHRRLDQSQRGAGAKGVGLEERGGVFPHLLQQRAQSAADALASGRRVPEERLRAEERRRKVSCSSLSSREGGAALALEREKSLRLQLEQQLREHVGQVINLQTRMDAERSGLSLRLSDSLRESERLKGQIQERDREVAVLTKRLKEQSVNDETDVQLMTTHTESLLDTLRDIAQTVLPEGDSSSEADQENSGAPLLALFHGSSPRRSASPSRPSSLPLLPDSALSALRSAVTNKALQLQVTCWRWACFRSQASDIDIGLCWQDARGRLIASQSSVQQLRKQLSEADVARRDTEQRSQSLQRERDAAQREKEAALKEKERLKQERDGLASEKASLEKTVQAAQGSSQLLEMEVKKLQLTVTSALRERDHEREQKEAAVVERERAKAESQRIEKQLEQSESRLSAQRGEMSAARETFQKGEVERQLLEGERVQLSEALARAESRNAELTLLLNKLQSEEAALRDSLAKDIELSRTGLDTELLSLREEKAKLQERVTQVESSLDPTQGNIRGFTLYRFGGFWQLCGEVSSLGSELSLAKGEGQRTEVALEEAGRSQAELVRDKAALTVQLTASEKENSMLSEELAAFRCARAWHAGGSSPHPAGLTCARHRRSERESLETSLFEAQQQLLQAESRREQLEAENQTLRVRSETAAAEVRRLRSDGENASAQAEREKQALTQSLKAAQLEAQQALHKVISEHQEE
ncbi:unnamed protein product, partial [Tetraodon nigroviridis]